MTSKGVKELLKDWLAFRKAVEAPPETQAKFELYYDDILVGTLTVEKGLWRFEYSDQFKRQDDLRPLVEFPDVNEQYESRELWQFFVMRIPSPEQAEVEEILKREHIEEDDAVSLLKRFGERTINNPFRLRAA